MTRQTKVRADTKRSAGDARGRGAREAKEVATYVYCVVKRPRGRRAPASGRAPKGLAGTPSPRTLDAGDGYELVVTSAPLALYDGAIIDAKLRDLDWVGQRAVEHEAVVEHSTKLGTVIPMKLFTLFKSDERAVAHVRKLRPSLDRVVDKISGCEEWGLRVSFDPARASKAAEARLGGARRPVSGLDFLMRKKALDDERRFTGARLAAEVDALYERLAKTARGAQRRPVPAQSAAGRVLLDAVFLVPKKSVTKIKTAVASSADDLVEAGFNLALTGPWPAYSFIGGT